MSQALNLARMKWLPIARPGAWIIVAPALFGALLGFLLSFTFARKYTSRTLLLIEPADQNDSSSGSFRQFIQQSTNLQDLLSEPRLKSMMDRINNDESLGKSLSPTLHLTKDTPPALLLFGTKDQLLTHGEEYVAKSKEAGNRAELFLAEGQGHGFFNRSPWQERTTKRVDEFLRSLGYVQGEPTIEAR